MVTLDQIQVALVVEDDFLIAIDMQTHLERLGCRDVQTANTVESALEFIRAGVQFAVLDISLGGKSCAPIAEMLTALGIPFFYFSGYPRSSHPDLPDAPWLAKPAGDADVEEAVSATLSRPTKPIEPFVELPKPSEEV